MYRSIYSSLVGLLYSMVGIRGHWSSSTCDTYQRFMIETINDI